MNAQVKSREQFLNLTCVFTEAAFVITIFSASRIKSNSSIFVFYHTRTQMIKFIRGKIKSHCRITTHRKKEHFYCSKEHFIGRHAWSWSALCIRIYSNKSGKSKTRMWKGGGMYTKQYWTFSGWIHFKTTSPTFLLELKFWISAFFGSSLRNASSKF